MQYPFMSKKSVIPCSDVEVGVEVDRISVDGLDVIVMVSFLTVIEFTSVEAEVP